MDNREQSLPFSWRDVIAAMGQAVIVTDAAGVVLSWNPAAERLYGWREAEALGRPINDLTVPEVSQRDSDEILAALRAGEPWSGSFTVRHRDGSTFQALVTTTAVRDADGEVVALVGVSVALGQAVRPLLEHSNDAAAVIGVDGRIQFTSPAMADVFGWSADELVGRSAVSLLHPDDAPLLERALRATGSGRRNGVGQRPFDVRVRARDGAWHPTEAIVADLASDPGLRGVVLRLRDATHRRTGSERLTRLALHDPLTGLPNRSAVADRIRHSQRRRGNAGALLLIDLEDLKTVNRQLGHAAGDELLRTLAARLDGSLSVEDTCGRVGGDEFLVLAEGVDTAEQAIELAQRLQVIVARPARAGGTAVGLRANIGITLLAGRRRAEELLRECVAAVYDAKETGPGQVAMFDRVGSGSHGQGGLVTRLRQGLAVGEVCVHYQPVVDLRTRDVVGVEALVRWAHPTRGLLSADAFTEAAENDDLIHDLGAFVLGEACQQVAGWPGPGIDLSVNVSARQLSERALATVVSECLESTGLAPERLVLEITETALMQDLAAALNVLSSCREQGVRVSLDDFGTGFAGFGYLRELPVDEVKIDRSFVTGVIASRFDTAIVRGIVEMAHGLGLRTTGEGVETARQAGVLVELGCDRAQGYLWSPAVPAGAVAPGIPSSGLAPLQGVLPDYPLDV